MSSEASTSKKSKKKSSKSELSRSIVRDSDNDSEHEAPENLNGIDDALGMDDESNSSSLDNGWSTDDDSELVTKVEQIANPNDKVNYKTRLGRVDWSTIAFKRHSADECQERFKHHLKFVRRFRTLNEIVADMKTNIKKCPIKKPLNSYQLFIKDQLANTTSSGDFSETMKNLAHRYKALPANEKSKYEREAEVLKAEYKLAKASFENGTPFPDKKQPSKKPKSADIVKPKTPFSLFAEDVNAREGETESDELRERYKELPIDEKYKYIVKAVSLAPDVNQATLLNKEEQRIFNHQIKPTPTGYNLFLKEVFPKIKGKYKQGKELFTEVSKRWNSLDDKQRKVYLDSASLLKQRAKVEQEKFNERLGFTPNKKLRKRSASCHASIMEQEDEDHMFASPPQPPIKKRKESESMAAGSASDEPSTPKKKNIIPMTVIHTPLRHMDEERGRLNSEMSESNTEHLESDSSAMISAKKKIKKEKKKKKSKEVPEPEDKPPSTLIEYFAKHIHTGKPKKAKKAFEKLTKKEKKQLSAEFNEKVENYMAQLKTYLASLSEQDRIVYITKVKAEQDAKANEFQAGNESSQEY